MIFLFLGPSLVCRYTRPRRSNRIWRPGLTGSGTRYPESSGRTSRLTELGSRSRWRTIHPIPSTCVRRRLWGNGLWWPQHFSNRSSSRFSGFGIGHLMCRTSQSQVVSREWYHTVGLFQMFAFCCGKPPKDMGGMRTGYRLAERRKKLLSLYVKFVFLAIVFHLSLFCEKSSREKIGNVKN